ncbi:MAG: ribonuclease III [Candidatus Omnitrophica bacterium]|nr:ribonuclease III [Candidatus Omnitrophota bacterium]
MTAAEFLQQKKEHFRKCEKAWGLSFRAKHRLAAALTHSSYRHETLKVDLEDFERLEFFGDAVLNFVVSEKLYAVFPEADEGFLSRLRSILVSKRVLMKVADSLRLNRHVLLGKSAQKQSKRDQGKILADTVEALIAAVYFDRGLEKTRSFILRHYAPFLTVRYLQRLNVNPKSQLQEWVQKYYRALPRYEFELKNGGFVVWARAGESARAKGEGHSKKEAEERAARKLLALLKKKTPLKGLA